MPLRIIVLLALVSGLAMAQGPALPLPPNVVQIPGDGAAELALIRETMARLNAEVAALNARKEIVRLRACMAAKVALDDCGLIIEDQEHPAVIVKPPKPTPAK